LRVAIIIPRLDRFGPVLLIQTLVDTFAKFTDLKVVVIYLDKLVDPSMKMSVPMERYNFGSCCLQNYDIIHTNGFRPDLLAFLNRRKIKYHISTIHNFVFEDLKFTYNRLISILLGRVWLRIWQRADKLVCISKAMKGYYGKWFNELKLEVIYNGIAGSVKSVVPEDDLRMTIDEFHRRGLKVAAVIGTMTRRKGFDQILNLLDSQEEYALMLFGDGKEYSDLHYLAKKLKIEDRCFFCGFRPEAHNNLRYFDFFIMPSRSEGFGLALIEAVQQKVPVICSDIEVFKELLNSNEVTFFKLEDTDSLVDAMKISEDSGKQKTELAYKRFLNNYTAEIMADTYYKLYQSATV
jgi:glycosyltransferase involved in cell wall biosynthesis